jgi:hypothetical protein
MALPTITAVNSTGAPILLTRLGLTVGAASSLTLTDYAWPDEIRQDESLEAAISGGSIVLNYGNGNLNKGDSLKFFNVVTQEVRISVRLLEDLVNVTPLSGAGGNVDGTATVVEDRVLLTSQSTASENGIWVVKAGVWQRPEDFNTAQSAAGAIAFVHAGATNSLQTWNCTSLPGADIIGTSNLAFAQLSGGGGGAVTNLQTAYEGGNTIGATAAEGDIAFTLTSADFTVDGPGSMLFGGGAALAAFDVDTGTMSLDSTDTTNLTMTANDGGDKVLTIAASNAGVGNGNIAMTADGTIDFDAAGDLSLNSSGGALNIGDDADTGGINIGTGASARTIIVGNATGATQLDFNSGTGGTLIDSTGIISLDGVGGSNFTTDTGNLTLQTTTSGGVLVDSAGVADIQAVGAVTIDSSGALIGIGTDDDDFAINLGTNGERQITIGNNTGVTGVAIETGTGDLLIDAPLTTMTGNLVVDGTTTTVHSEVVNISDNFLYLNADYTTASAEEGGVVVNYLPTSTNDTVAATGFVARAGAANAYVYVTEAVTGLDAVMDTLTLPQATITVDSTTGFPASGTIYVTTSAGVQTVTYTGTTPTTFTGCAGGTGTMSTGGLVSTSATALPTADDFVQVSGAADQSNDGLYEVLSNLNGVLTIQGLGTTPGTYSFTQNDFTADTTVQGTITVVTVGAMQVDSGGDWQVGSGADSGAFTFVDIITSATLSLQTAYDGGQTITTDGSGNVLIAGTQALQVTATGGIDLDTVFDADVSVFDVLMTGNNGFSIDGTADSNVTATNTVATTPVTLTLAADNQGATSGDATVDINATSTNGSGIVDIDADDAVAVDVGSGGTIDIGTNAAANTTTIGNNTGATGVDINSGTEMVQIDGVTYYGNSAGNPAAIGAGFADGDKYYDTGLDMEMRYDATRAKWLSVESMTFLFGRDGNTASPQYYRSGGDGRVMSSTEGWAMPHNGTVVAAGYTRTDTDLAVVDFVEGGTSRATQTMTAAVTTGVVTNLDGDFTAAGILAAANQTGGNTTSNVTGWVKVRFRA